MGIRQQTYIIPFDPGDPKGSENVLAGFLRNTKSLLDGRKLSLTLLDILYLPDEADDAFPLSSSRDLPGFAVTLTFEKLLSTRFKKEESALRDIAELCAKLGGRIHLTKNVCADPEIIAKMYETGIAEMRCARAASHAEQRLSNDFMVRVLPGLL